jgi:hypothetical protein
VLAMQVAQLGQESYAAALGVRGPLSLRARMALEVAAYDMLTGEVVRQATLGSGGLFEVTGREALLIKARR